MRAADLPQRHDAFTKAAAPHAGDPEAAVEAMGDAYDELLRNSDLLLCQLHGYAACQEPAIRVAVRQGYKELVELVQHLSGAPDEEIQRFFAVGMLINVVAAMDAHELDEPWAQALMSDVGLLVGGTGDVRRDPHIPRPSSE